MVAAFYIVNPDNSCYTILYVNRSDTKSCKDYERGMGMRRQKGLNFYRKRKKISPVLVKEIISWTFGVLVTVFIAYVLSYFVGMTTNVIGVSMEPNLYNGQTIFVDRFSYVLSSPQKGDVIVFLPNGNVNAHYYVKRVIAVPGDTVQIIEGRLYVNGKLQEDEFDKMADAGIAENAVFLKKDEYFVLGDNRNSSEDSRSANIGPVKREDIIGKAWFRLGTKEKAMGFIK